MKARERMKIRTKRAFRHMTPRHIVRSRLARRSIQDFAEKVGFVYFGYVDQKDDDHRLVRGHTVSATHLDNHYCIGTLRGYDVALVSRNDVIVTRDKHRKQQRCHWLIYTIDLHSSYDVPHMYIGHKSRDDAYMASYEQLIALHLGTVAQYTKRFLNDYTIYSIPSRSVEIEQIIHPQLADVISTHFKGASIEIEDNTIYLYIESQHPDEVLLERMLSNGLWLAENIDAILRPQKQD